MAIAKLLLSTTLSALLLSGCSQKTPDLEAAEIGKNNVSDATLVAGKTVSIDSSTYGNENTNKQNDMSNESNSDALNASNVNSSSHGFKSLYFGFGDYSISTSMENRTISNSNVASSNQSAKIKIEGNCDEFGTDEYNYALGLKRAKAVKNSMISQGVDAGSMVIVSFGESNPVCSNPTDGCYAQNRRVDLHLVK